MKVFALLIAMTFSIIAYAQTYKPYILGAEETGNLEVIQQQVENTLQSQGIQLLGTYNPAEDPDRLVMAFTAPELIQSVEKVGGLAGFAAVLRVAITRDLDNTIVSYNNPLYWGNAYYQDDFPKVRDLYLVLDKKLRNAMNGFENPVLSEFGSKKGRDAETLRKYRYKIMMPHFDDTEVIASYNSFAEAVRTIDANLDDGISDIIEVYSLEIPGTELKLYGIGMRGEIGESSYITTIDDGEYKHTAYFPYEMLVVGNEVHMLKGRYRIAISFPDTGMGQFMKIVKAPGNIQEMLERIVQ